MTYIFEKINRVFIQVARLEKDPIDRARIQMLSYILTFYPVFTAILILAHIISGETLYLIRVLSVFSMTSFLFGVVYFTHAWKLVTHVVLLLCTLVIWSNLLVYIQGVDIETIQVVWLGCVISFYMLGSRWGWFYSAIYILPIIIYTAFNNNTYFKIGISPIEMSKFPYLFVICYNFCLIIFLQYYFFKEFNQNFFRLTRTKDALKVANTRLELSLDDVERLSNAKMEFLSTMSHELRTPLHGVIGMSNVLLAQTPRKDQEENLAVLKFSAEN